MVSEQRQRVIETNRSLRTIKNELESLLEKGVITESAFDEIQSLLPTESSLSAAPTPAQRNHGLPAPSSSSSNSNNNRASSPAPPTAALAALSVSPPPGPPSYNQSTGAGSGPPPLPGRHQPPPAPPSKPVIARARALYRYAASDARDCSFERDDTIEVHEYMNGDWWMGRNTRTGAEGIFPKNYVEALADTAAPQHNEKAGWNNANANANSGYPGAGGYGAGGGYQPPPQAMYGAQHGGGYPPPPGQVNPYNAHAPPMAVANEQQQGGAGESKAAGAGKKFGKKLGNAAIFGAGATIGSNIVNSIF